MQIYKSQYQLKPRHEYVGGVPSKILVDKSDSRHEGGFRTSLLLFEAVRADQGFILISAVSKFVFEEHISDAFGMLRHQPPRNLDASF